MTSEGEKKGSGKYQVSEVGRASNKHSHMFGRVVGGGEGGTARKASKAAPSVEEEKHKSEKRERENQNEASTAEKTKSRI